jgi:hypothetical protein
MTPEEVLYELGKNGNIDKPKVISMVKKLTVSGTAKLKPAKVKIGDIFYHQFLNHPCVVIARVSGQKGQYWVAGLSSDEKVSITELRTRYTYTSYVTSTLSTISADTVLKTYRGSITYAEAKRVRTLIKQIITTI